MWTNRARRLLDEAKVGRMVGIDWRGDADDEDIGRLRLEPRFQLTAVNGRTDENVEVRLFDVNLAAIDGLDHVGRTSTPRT